MMDLAFLLVVISLFLTGGFLAGFVVGEMSGGRIAENFYDKKIRQIERRILKEVRRKQG